MGYGGFLSWYIGRLVREARDSSHSCARVAPLLSDGIFGPLRLLTRGRSLAARPREKLNWAG